MSERKKLSEGLKAKTKLREKALMVQDSVKANLLDWIINGDVEIQLKKIILDPNIKASERIRAIEVMCKLAGFVEAPQKVAHTDSEGKDVKYTNVNFEELKAIWMSEMISGQMKSFDENADYLIHSDEVDLEELLDEEEK